MARQRGAHEPPLAVIPEGPQGLAGALRDDRDPVEDVRLAVELAPVDARAVARTPRRNKKNMVRDDNV